jgi:WhiB family redox-sensing transcriptional regulator
MTMTETDTTWRQEASCAGYSPETFFPSRGDMETLNLALSLCSECPVKELCLSNNIHERSGIFGGTTGRERKLIRLEKGSRSCVVCGKRFPIFRSKIICSDECRIERRLSQKRSSNDRRQSVRRAEAKAIAQY